MPDPDEQVYLDAARAYEQCLRMKVGADQLAATPALRAVVEAAWRAGRASTQPAGPRTWTLPDIRAGVYRHYKGHHYLVLGYGHDANQDGRAVVVYVGLELDGARTGPRLAVRTVGDFLAIVDPRTGEAKDFPYPSPDYPLRFTYVGPSWLPAAEVASGEEDGDG